MQRQIGWPTLTVVQLAFDRLGQHLRQEEFMTTKLMRLDVCLPPIFGTKGRTAAPAPQTRISRIQLRAEIAAATFAVASAGVAIVSAVAHAGNETVLHSFSSVPDGAYPEADLVIDKAGNLYGTTIFGGSSGFGTVFKLDRTGNESVLY